MDVFLDTSVIYLLLDPAKAPAAATALASLRSQGARIRLPEPSLYELLEQLQQGRLPWTKWRDCSGSVTRLLDRADPIGSEYEPPETFRRLEADRGREAALMDLREALGVLKIVWDALACSSHPATFNAIMAGHGIVEGDGAMGFFGAVKELRLGGISEKGRDLRDACRREGETPETFIAETRRAVSHPLARHMAIRARCAEGQERKVDRNTPFDALIGLFAEIPDCVVITCDEATGRASAHLRVLHLPQSGKGMPSDVAGLERELGRQVALRPPA